ncbi:MAG: glucose-6-phosphate isomerase, partial [Candidatus Margulisiibacteriota bacterium]
MKKVVSLRTNIKQKNLDQLPGFAELKTAALKGVDLRTELTPERIKKMKVTNGPLSFFYAGSLVNEKMLDAAQKIADQAKVIERYQSVLNGEVMNPSEKRKVSHHQPRALSENLYTAEQKKIDAFAAKVHKGEIRGATGKKITTVVQIGIGGSDLGPRAFYDALETGVAATKGKVPLKAHFISNVDPDDANSILNNIDF